MKIKITNEKSGLEVGKEYDLCDMAAKTLITKRHAVIVEKAKPVEKVKTVERAKPVEKDKRKNK